MANAKIPREKIPWYPTINYDACINDQECLNFCKNDVLSLDAESGRVVVTQPNNCVVGCDSCAQICPVDAIAFPDKEELRITLRWLREEGAVPSLAKAP
jgi:NAD-dependent dihydropyrimidine dehydrogenase PreA subunit